MNLAEGVSWATPTTMTVVDTLPKGVSYLPGTSFYGGTYKANSTPGYPGTVEGGRFEEPEIKVIGIFWSAATIPYYAAVDRKSVV